MSRIRGLLELARISNMPTCVTNVLVGCAIGGVTELRVAPIFGLVAVAIGMMYVGGMALNDAVDAAMDREERPGRPVPSGRVSRRSAFVIGFGALGIGLAALAPLGIAALGWGVALVAVIVAYDFLHKRLAASVALMGLCRGLVYVVAAVAVNPNLDAMTVLPIAGAMTAYVAVVTRLAQGEAQSARPVTGRLLWLLPVPLLLPALVVGPSAPAPTIAAGLVMIVWIVAAARHLRASPPRPPHAIMAWLAGICLADGWFLCLLDRPWLALAAGACFLLTTWGHQRILGS
ncbi:MAG: UbiA family prenyltransferase [Planctomycetes bacterium]|nr:UbiA family prenyltransferase [Planctomycetota bacterium]